MESEAWKRLLNILKEDPAISAEATDAVREYTDAVHELAHEFLDNASENGVHCDQLRDFMLGLLRLGYLRARVGSTVSDEVPSEEKGCHPGEKIMGPEEMSRLLKDIECDV